MFIFTVYRKKRGTTYLNGEKQLVINTIKIKYYVKDELLDLSEKVLGNRNEVEVKLENTSVIVLMT